MQRVRLRSRDYFWYSPVLNKQLHGKSADVVATPRNEADGKAFAGGPQMVEISRDGKRVYWTNSLYSTWDDQFYPGGVPGVQVMANAKPGGGLALDKDYWVSFADGYRAHQIRLDGGDCSTDSFCYPSV